MAKRRTDSNRRDLATWLMMLLPGFMFVGMLAPAAVSVKPKAEAEDVIGPISFRNFRPRQPIQFSLPQAGVSESALEPVFAGARYFVGQAKNAFEIGAKADDGGKQQIVLDEDSVESYVQETLFDVSAKQPGLLAVELDPIWDPTIFDVIPDLIDRRGVTQWDDFHGTGVLFLSGAVAPPGNVIPEPATGGLLAIGLAALAVRRKRA